MAMTKVWSIIFFGSQWIPQLSSPMFHIGECIPWLSCTLLFYLWIPWLQVTCKKVYFQVPLMRVEATLEVWDLHDSFYCNICHISWIHQGSSAIFSAFLMKIWQTMATHIAGEIGFLSVLYMSSMHILVTWFTSNVILNTASSHSSPFFRLVIPNNP